MGFSIAASHIIFFIAVVAIAASVVAVFSDYVDQAKGAMGDKQSRLTDQLKTDVKIVNVLYDTGTNPDTLLVYAKNIGTKKLDVDCIDLFIDSAYETLAYTDIIDPSTADNTTIWELEQTLQLNASQNGLSSDIHEAKIITCNGVSTSYDFST